MKISVGAHMIEVEPFVREAVDTLGYFRPEFLDEVAAVFARTEGAGAASIFWERTEELSDAEKIAAGRSAKARMPRQLWRILSDKGRADPRHATMATGLRIVFNLYRERDRLDEPTRAKFCDRAKFMGAVDATCASARHFEGLVLAIGDRFAFPLADCDAEWCACNWLLFKGK